MVPKLEPTKCSVFPVSKLNTNSVISTHVTQISLTYPENPKLKIKKLLTKPNLSVAKYKSENMLYRVFYYCVCKISASILV